MMKFVPGFDEVNYFQGDPWFLNFVMFVYASGSCSFVNIIT